MKSTLTLLLFIICILNQLKAQNATYQVPSEEILQLADYTRPPSVRMDNKHENIFYFYRNTYKRLQDLNQEEMRLAGLRINPITYIGSTVTYYTNIAIKKINSKEVLNIKGMPLDAKITYASFSSDESKMAFTNTVDNGVELWVIDIASATATKLTAPILNACMGIPYEWMADNNSILIKTRVANKKLIDTKATLPKGPTVSISEGKASQNRTYADLLKNPQDEQNFEALITSELKIVNINGVIKNFKDADLYTGMNISPDGQYILIKTTHPPYSYIVPNNRFPSISTVYDISAKQIAIVNEDPLIEVMPKGFSSTKTGKRSLSWRSDKSATLFYVEALDEGDPSKKVPFRDALYCWDVPFNTSAKFFFKTQQRFSDITWGNENIAIVEDSWYDTRNSKTYLVNPASSNDDAKIIFDRNYQDIYTEPGNFETKHSQYHTSVLAIEKNKVYLIGDGFTENGQFPFINEMDLSTFKIKRLYTSNYTNKKEEIIEFIDFKKGTVMVGLQSATDYPNYYIRNIYKKGEPVAMTNFENPFSALNNVKKELLSYEREDGVKLSGTLYTPANYKSGDKLPLLIWAYPEEFKDKNSAGQNNKNPNEFTFPTYGSFVYWVNKGYVVLDDASFPIVGEGTEEPNDKFMPQLVANAKAAIDAVDAKGIIDRKKVAIGGHSYGAFMTANLLTHSNLFACGIARSGAYNRTLTPFGFQSEQRNYWDIPQVYNSMSPFMQANKMKTPLLLVHGEADNNPGTFTLQSERYFQALKGLGAPVKLLLLPKESHGYAAKENIFHLLWEQDQFLEKYLKK
jgi:dipeptidyl aminopeptidase/acylaminoacyl peptidase